MFEHNKEFSELNFDGLREYQKYVPGEFNSFLKNDNGRVFVLQQTSNSGKTYLKFHFKRFII